MQIFVGLGNPGAGYARHRHNIGFMAVDAIAERHGFGPERKRFQGATREGLIEATVGATKVLILKPQTYMNLSGHSVGEALAFFKLPAEAVTVFHDELDLAPGRVKVKTGGGHAGHNGLRSMTAQIGAGFRRVRLGIGHPGDKSLVSNYVLSDFAKADQPWLAALLDEVAREVGLLVAGRDTDFMTRVAERLKDLVPDTAGRSSAGE